MDFLPTENFEFITLAEAKAHLRLDDAFDYENDLITGMVSAAISAAEAYINRIIVGEDFTASGVNFASLCFADWRNIKINGVQVLLEGADDYSALTTAQYTFRRSQLNVYRMVPAPGVIVQDVADAVTITGVVSVPFAVKQACLLILGDFYTYRENRADVGNDVAKRLLFPYRNFNC